MNNSSKRSKPNAKEVGTLPVQSNLCTSLIAVSTALWTKFTTTTKTKQKQQQQQSVRKAIVDEQLCSKTIHPAMRAKLHLPTLHLCWAVGVGALGRSYLEPPPPPPSTSPVPNRLHMVSTDVKPNNKPNPPEKHSGHFTFVFNFRLHVNRPTSSKRRCPVLASLRERLQ